MNFQTAMTTIARVCPDMTLREANALALALSGLSPDLSTHEGRVEFARSLHEVTSNLPDRKITAIKALRDASMHHGPAMTLIDAKNAVEALPGGRFL